MFTSRDLKATIADVRPIIERQLDDATLIAGYRESVTAKGGDWSQLKALVKAMIQDERDESGGHKRVLAILHKADHALGYADMLGLGNLNEKNSFAEEIPPHDEDGVILETENGGDLVTPRWMAADHGTDDAGGDAADLHAGGNDVAPSPAHAPEQPGTDHGSVNPPSEGGANSDALPIATAVSPQPAGADRSGVATSLLPGSTPVNQFSITPLEAREAGGLKGFGFTVNFGGHDPGHDGPTAQVAAE